MGHPDDGAVTAASLSRAGDRRSTSSGVFKAQPEGSAGRSPGRAHPPTASAGPPGLTHSCPPRKRPTDPGDDRQPIAGEGSFAQPQRKTSSLCLLPGEEKPTQKTWFAKEQGLSAPANPPLCPARSRTARRPRGADVGWEAWAGTAAVPLLFTPGWCPGLSGRSPHPSL